MRFKGVFGILGMLFCAIGLSTIVPLVCAIYYGESRVAWSMLICLVLLFGTGSALTIFLNRKNIDELNHREGMFTVGAGWFMVCLCGSLPYLISGAVPSIPDAIFESFSGFTTTGATILSDVESLPKSILLWRALSHWLGGIGIIVMFLAMLPYLGIGGLQVYRVEMPELFGEKLTPRVKETVKVLCLAYILFTIVLLILLLLGGMSLFDSVCYTFSIVPSGGFANHNTSMANYQSSYLQWVVIIFMFLTGMNYAIHYKVLRGNFRILFKNEELRLYFLIVVVVSFVIMLCLYKEGVSLEESMRESMFQVVSIMTTTGLTTSNYETWPVLAQALLLIVMFIGGCGGSTTGGFKCMRLLLLLKCAYDEFVMLLHPRAIRRLKLGKVTISNEEVNSVLNYFIIFSFIIVGTTLFLAALGFDLVTSFSSAISCTTCTGPALGLPGASGNYSVFPGIAKLVLSVVMLMGRIEIYALLVLVMPSFWKD